jgi:hypothetical protein
LTRLPWPDSVAALSDREIVIEAIVEDEQAKVDLFRRLSEVIDQTGAIFASNTSSTPIVQLAAVSSDGMISTTVRTGTGLKNAVVLGRRAPRSSGTTSSSCYVSERRTCILITERTGQARHAMLKRDARMGGAFTRSRRGGRSLSRFFTRCCCLRERSGLVRRLPHAAPLA